MKISSPPPDQIGAEVSDFHPQSVTPEQVNKFKELVYQHKLLVFRDQTFSNEDYIEFARAIGTPQIYFQPNYHHPDHPEIFVSSNVLEDGKKIGVAGTGRYWHTDYQFFEEPLPLTMLYPKRLPHVNRETYYIDMERVYRRMPEHLKAYVDNHRAIHEAKWRYKVQAEDIDKSITEILEEFGKETPAVTHPAIIVHPVTKAKSLYISEGFTVGLEGMRYEESKAALRELFDFIHREEHIHVHRWVEGDVLLWDNRVLLHKASTVPKGQQSTSYRIGVYDGLPFYLNG